jgi:hypothetical protein
MVLIMKTNSITQKIILVHVHHINTKVLGKKTQIFAKTFHLLSSTWTLFLKLPLILDPIQVVASTLENHDYNNLTFEVDANKS